jgi:hypothetical protein
VNARGAGGYWKTVLASEDYVYDADKNLIGHDKNPENDLVFTIGDDPAIRAMKVFISDIAGTQKGKKWQAKTQVIVTDALNRRIRGATVQGVWTGPTNTVVAEAKTGADGRSDGIANFTSPEAEAKSGDIFKFTVTKVIKTGRTWDWSQFPAAAARVP